MALPTTEYAEAEDENGAQSGKMSDPIEEVKILQDGTWCSLDRSDPEKTKNPGSMIAIDPGFPFISEITGMNSVRELIPSIFRQVF